MIVKMNTIPDCVGIEHIIHKFRQSHCDKDSERDAYIQILYICMHKCTQRHTYKQFKSMCTLVLFPPKNVFYYDLQTKSEGLHVLLSCTISQSQIALNFSNWLRIFHIYQFLLLEFTANKVCHTILLCLDIYIFKENSSFRLRPETSCSLSVSQD